MPKPQSGRGAIVELVAIVALAIGLALLIQAFVVKPYQIPSESMEPTLDVGQRVLVNRFIYHLHDPHIGDIVVFHPPAGATDGGAEQCGHSILHRGLPHPDAGRVRAELHQAHRRRARRHASVKNGHPVVNGVEAKEDFIRPCNDGSSCNLPKPITIPPDHYFMMGDNRGESDDSRFWGPVPRAWIIGEAFFTYWPPDRIGFL